MRKYIKPASVMFQINLRDSLLSLSANGDTLNGTISGNFDNGEEVNARGGFFDDGMDVEEDSNW